ncbi:hypothetical protein Q2401_25435, partial [Escherichia coli]|nr:hypothetical protein [Escherichia coli]
RQQSFTIEGLAVGGICHGGWLLNISEAPKPPGGAGCFLSLFLRVVFHGFLTSSYKLTRHLAFTLVFSKNTASVLGPVSFSHLRAHETSLP